MRPRVVIAAAAALYLLAGSGCFLRDRWFGTVTPPPDQVVTASHQTTPADRRIQLHTRLIEQPHGHDYLTRGLWADAVDPLPPELSARLAANGLRVGVISGSVPDELENLGRTAAISPMLRTVQVDQPKTVPVNGPIESVTVLVRAEPTSTPQPKQFERVECGVMVTSTPTADGRVRLRCEPRMQHGSRRPYFQPTADGFDREDRRPTEEFPALAWEVMLSASDVLVVGSTAEPDDDALGAAFFLARTPDRWRQRVFTLQATSTAPTPAARGVTAALVR
ncbi:MAG: hypothetical protein ABGY75_06800 [Gemmataceae bacterium]